MSGLVRVKCCRLCGQRVPLSCAWFPLHIAQRCSLPRTHRWPGLTRALCQDPGSNSENQITHGHLSSSSCLPWARSTCGSPKGNICALCTLAYDLGGFKAEYDTMPKFEAACKAKQDSQTEFMAARDQVISFCNNGTLTQRLKGSKRDQIVSGVQDARKIKVDLVRSESMAAKTPFRAGLSPHHTPQVDVCFHLHASDSPLCSRNPVLLDDAQLCLPGNIRSWSWFGSRGSRKTKVLCCCQSTKSNMAIRPRMVT